VAAEVVVAIVHVVLGAFLDVLDTFLGVLDRSVLAFLSLCWPFIVIITFEQQPRHQQAGDSEEDSFLVLD
jgi:hypothetical protein